MSELQKNLSQLSPLKLALLAQKIRTGVEGVEYVGVEPIAVVGMGCRFPGGPERPEGVSGPEEFWKLMTDGVDAVREVPEYKWNADAYYNEDRDVSGKIYTKNGAYLDDIDLFDAEFFGISPKEAASMDPQQRLALTVAYEALEDAGISLEKVRGSQTGVFMGVGQNDYADLELKARDETGINAYTGTGLLFSAISGRISYAFGLHGPSDTLDWACSSSLATIHRACQSLRQGECDLALAGGVHLIVTPNMTVWLSRSTAISPDGRCKTFDDSANGYSRGEGCGIVVLKRLSDALKDGDRVLALIRGSAVNHGGAAQGFTVPNGTAQQSLLKAALENSGVTADQVSYIEAHGTGTKLGDPIEVNALNAVFAKKRSKNNPLWIGSVKTNIGHLETAAGVAGLMKVVLALKNKRLPPHLHFKKGNPHIDFDAIPAKVPVQAEAWNPPGGRRIAGVSSFGITGQNAHVILEEMPALPEKQSAPPAGPYVLVLSARSQAALMDLVERYEDFLNDDLPEGITLYDVCSFAALRRSHHEFRLAVAGDSAEEMARKLSMLRSGDMPEGTAMPRQILKGKPQIAFVFSGQGPQWFAMGHELFKNEPVYREKIEEIDGLLAEHAGWSLITELNKDEASSRIMDTEIGQPAIFALQVALAELWKSRGVEPSAVVGHSVGEVAAACVSGTLPLKEAVFVIYHRARLMQQATGLGKMAAVELPAEELKPALKGFEGRLELGAINGPRSCVLSGEESALQEVLGKLEARGVHVKMLPVDYAFHSPQMEPYKAELTKILANVETKSPSVLAYSTVTGKEVTKSDYDARYWGRNIREPVSFAPAIAAMARDGYNVFVEISPHPVLGNYIQAALEEADSGDAGVAHSLRRKADERVALLAAAGTVHSFGCHVNFHALFPVAGKHVQLPAYPWQNKSYWIKVKDSGAISAQPETGEHYFLGRRVRSPMNTIQFESVFTDEMPYTFKDHVLYGEIVVPGASHLSMCLSGARRAFGRAKYTIIDSFFHQALVLRKGDARFVQLIFEPDGEDKYNWSVHSTDARDSGTSTWVLHATGKLEVSEVEPKPEIVIDPEEMKKKYPKHFNREEFYKFFLECGYDLTDTFRWADECWWKEGEAFILMTAPDGVYDADQYILFPSLIDAQYQAGTTAYPKEEPDANDEGGLAYHVDENHIYVPWNNRRIQFFGDYDGDGTKFWSHIRLKDTRHTVKRGQEVFRGDLDLYDPDGRLVATFEDWALKRVSADSLLKLIRSGGDWLYELAWKPAALRGKKLKNEQAARWAIFADRGGYGAKLAEALRAQGKDCALAFAGSSYSKKGDGEFELDANDPESFESFLNKAFGEQPTGLVYCWGLDETPVEQAGNASLLKEQREIIGGLLQFGVGMNRVDWKNFPSLRVISRGAQAVDSGEPASAPLAAGLWGMGRVIALENPDVWRGAIDLEQGGADEIENVVKELLTDGGEDHVLFRGGKRYAADIIPHRTKPGSDEPEFKKDGGYLVTGGLGGLGLETAAWMAERGAGHLGLIGRSAPSDETKKRIAQMEKLGVKVSVLQGDVSKKEDVERIFKEAAAAFPAIKGVVHAAGVLEDGILTQQTWERYEKVLAPKVTGTWNLHEASAGIDGLDFFVLFSSVSALTGSPGQSNYAAANAFLDALAAYRRYRGLPATSVAWGPWADVGMAANIKEDAAKRGWRAEGLGIIDLKNGMQVFGQLTDFESAAVAVMPFRWPKLFEQFPQMAKQTMFTSIAKRFAPAGGGEADAGGSDALKKITAAPPEKQRELLGEFVKAQVARVLGFDPAQPIDPTRGFFDLGGDSLTSVQLRNMLQTALEKSLPTTMIFDYPSIEAITGYLAGDVLQLQAGAAAPDAAAKKEEEDRQARDKLAEEVDALSDEEAEKLLMQELADL